MEVKNYINNEHSNENHQRIPLHSPIDDHIIAEVAYATTSEIESAILAAKKAFSTWSQIPVTRRAQIFFRYQQLLKDQMDELANIVTREHGKTINDAKGSIQRGIEVVEFACGLSTHLSGRFNENIGTDVDCYSILQPRGICLGITPFNFPAMIPLWMFPIALMCGNTFILKPSERDPSCAVRLAELLTEAGAPPGILNVLHGDHEIVNRLITHPEIKAISFVGSSSAGKHIYETGTQHGKVVQAFCAAKNHGLVMPDADLESTIDAITNAAFGSTGQRCMALSVIVTTEDRIADHIIAGIQQRVQQIKIGPGHTDVDMGPMISKDAVARVEHYLQIGIGEGAQLIIDGRNNTPKNFPNGNFIGPCLFDQVKPNMKIYQEEIFGPVLCIVRTKNFQEALQLINDHPYGNGTAIFTRDGATAREFAHQVQVGMIGVNVPIPVPIAYYNFGGWKGSIFGDTQMHGPDSVKFFTRQKTITVRWPENKTSRVELGMPTLK